MKDGRQARMNPFQIQELGQERMEADIRNQLLQPPGRRTV